MGESCLFSLVSLSEDQIRTQTNIQREDHMKTQEKIAIYKSERPRRNKLCSHLISCFQPPYCGKRNFHFLNFFCYGNPSKRIQDIIKASWWSRSTFGTILEATIYHQQFQSLQLLTTSSKCSKRKLLVVLCKLQNSYSLLCLCLNSCCA